MDPGSRGRIGPPSREAWHRLVPVRRRPPGLRLVPDREESKTRSSPPARDRRRADHLLPGDRPRAPPGRHRAVPDLEPRAQRHPPEPVRLGHPPERRLLHHLPRRDSSRRPQSCCSSSSGATGCGSFAGLGRSLRDRGIDPEDADAKLGWLLVVGTIPGRDPRPRCSSMRSADLFASPQSASFFLMLNGLLLFGARPSAAERRRRTRTTTRESLDRCRSRSRFVVGAAQAIALIPGFSRSGAAMGGGLLVGLSHKDAARFAFLLATRSSAPRPSSSCRSCSAPQAGRDPRSGARRVAVLGADRVLLRPLPDALLRDPNADPVRRLVPCVRLRPAPIYFLAT